MLGKLIKYEFRASGKILLPIYVSVMIMSVLSAFTISFPGNAQNMTFPELISVIIIILYGIFVFAAIVLSGIVSIFRFKKNLFDNEGYLMHTLPASTSSLIASKVIPAVYYQILGVVIAAVSGLIIILPNADLSSFEISELKGELSYLMDMYGDVIAIYCTEGIILTIASLVCATLMLFAAISAGHSTDKHKIRNSVLAYILLYVIAELINLAVLKIPFVQNIFNQSHRGIYAFSHILPALIAAQIFYGAVYFAICRYFIKNRLNLQ